MEEAIERLLAEADGTSAGRFLLEVAEGRRAGRFLPEADGTSVGNAVKEGEVTISV